MKNSLTHPAYYKVEYLALKANLNIFKSQILHS